MWASLMMFQQSQKIDDGNAYIHIAHLSRICSETEWFIRFVTGRYHNP